MRDSENTGIELLKQFNNLINMYNEGVRENDKKIFLSEIDQAYLNSVAKFEKYNIHDYTLDVIMIEVIDEYLTKEKTSIFNIMNRFENMVYKYVIEYEKKHDSIYGDMKTAFTLFKAKNKDLKADIEEIYMDTILEDLKYYDASISLSAYIIRIMNARKNAILAGTEYQNPHSITNEEELTL